MKSFLFTILFSLLAFGNGEISSPNMNMPIPAVGVTKGPQYATDINNSLLIIDSHNHTPGKGVPITPSGINISSDLTCNSNNVTAIRAARFSQQVSAIASASPDIGELYGVNGDLYYNDMAGNQIRITQSGAVTGATGTITGLPSGTASAAYGAGNGTFTFIKATATGANIDAGTYILRYPGSYPSPSGNYIALEAPTSLSGGYAVVFPTAAPAATAFLTMDSSGNLATAIPTSQGIGTANIATGAITTNQIATGAVTTNQIATGAVTTNQIAAQTISGNNISNQTITNTQITPQTITQSLLAPKTAGSAVGVGGFGISASALFTTTSSSYVDVTNLTLTITTTGRPVFIGLISSSSSSSFISATGTTSIKILQNGSSDVVMTIGSGSYAPTSIWTIDSSLGAGTYTYKVQAKNDTVGTTQFTNIFLIAYEL
jgi:hypothetical protein